MRATAFAMLCLVGGDAIATTRFALVVGHNTGDAYERPLRWAEADAARVHRALVEIGGITAERAKLLASPDRRAVDRALSELQGRIAETRDRGERSILIFYFSGHADRHALHLAAESLAVNALEARLRRAGATATVAIVDACRNDRAPRVSSKGALRAPSFAWPAESTKVPAGFVYMTSAASGEVAQESDDLQGSLFTHHLVSGLRGGADLDGDGAVTLQELYRHGHARTLQDTHRGTLAVQHSELEVDLAGEGSLIMAYPRRSRSVLELSADVTGYLLIIDDASGRIVGEYHRSASSPRRLALPPGTYRLQLRNANQVRAGLVDVRRGVTRLGRDALRRQSMVAVLSKGAGFDPYPSVVWADGRYGTSPLPGFGAAVGMGVGVATRGPGPLRWGVSLSLSRAASEPQLWLLEQIETDLSVLVDLERPVGPVTLTAGARVGALIVRQTGERTDAERLRRISAEAESSDWAAGPRAAAVLGVELGLSARIALRMQAEAAGVAFPVGGDRKLLLSANGAAGVIVRL